MKKIYSFVAALVVAMVVLASCGSMKTANEGIEAGKAYAAAFEAAQGDLQKITTAYEESVNKGQAYANDNMQTVLFVTGMLQSAEEKSADCAGSFLAIYNKAAANNGQDAEASIAAFMENAIQDKAGVKAAYEKYLAAIDAANNAAAQAAAEAAASDEPEEEGDGEEE